MQEQLLFSAYRYRLYPSGVQEMRLKRSLHALCELYNTLRAEKIHQYQQNHQSLSRTKLRSLALQIRRNNPKLRQIYSQAEQNVADRVAIAFKNYFQGRARFPRSKRFKEYMSFTYPQSGFKLENGRLLLSKIGKVRIFIHRPLQDTVHRLTIKYAVGEWYAILLTNRTEPVKLDINHVTNDKIRGGDLGLEQFVTLDNGESVQYPKFLLAAEERIKYLQRRLARKRKGSKRRRILVRQLARLHLHVARQREDWQNKLINTIFKECDVLVLEKLNVAGMLSNHHLAKAIMDSSWSKFASKCMRKADMLGKHVVFIDPYGTSQFCHQCLTWVPKTLADREHRCPNCDADLSRDLNSALLIRELGILSCSPSDGGLSPAEPKPLPMQTLRHGQAAALKREAQNL
ncbi:MAG: transposase [Candidatus Bathyarchaeia archaeon]